MSNNPFRNRINSHVSPQPSPRPISTNPFLDITEIGTAVENNHTNTNSTEATMTNDTVDKAADAFASLDVTDAPNELHKTRSRQANGGPRRPENSSLRGFPRPPGHRPTTSDEDKKRLQAKGRPELNIFADPLDKKPRDRHRRPRRNSESSVMDKTSTDPDEERRRRERKHRERAGSKSTRPNKKLDVIDKLDVTSIYGTGLFHHDGPFDACNPHRNRKKEKYAPMQAFPKDSINMVMGGSGPVNKTLDYDRYHGRGEEAHVDYNEAAIADESTEVYRKDPKLDSNYGYNPTARELLHGDESAGLGTSTFLEGAPASRAAIQRRESEYDSAQTDERPGLSRKKSLAQKIRGVRPNRDRFASPEGRMNGPVSPPITGQSDSAANPFFKDFNSETKKDATQVAYDEHKSNRARAPSSPRRLELERRNTTESAVQEEPSKPTGLLGRMKSLKGGRRPAVRRDTNS